MDAQLELDEVPTPGGIRHRWRHPLVRKGAWSRLYITRGAALAGAAMAIKHARKEAKDNDQG